MKIKKQRQLELPRFIVGALTATGATAANGATVQITFLNNYLADVANGGITNFNTDFTGGGVLFAGQVMGNYTQTFSGAPIAVLFAQRGYAVGGQSVSGYQAVIGVGTYNSLDVNKKSGPTSATLSGLIPYSFTDTRINNGLSTNGFLEVSATASAAGSYVNIHRLIFDDASAALPSGVISGGAAYPEWNAVSAVPEASSSLALLALGAGGLLTRRRKQCAA